MVGKERTVGVIMAAGPQPQFWKTHRPKNIMPSVAPPAQCVVGGCGGGGGGGGGDASVRMGVGRVGEGWGPGVRCVWNACLDGCGARFLGSFCIHML